MTKNALHILKEATDTTFEDCNIEGAKIEGRNTKMIRSNIYLFRKEHPMWWFTMIITLTVSVVAGIILLLIEYGYFVK